MRDAGSGAAWDEQAVAANAAVTEGYQRLHRCVKVCVHGMHRLKRRKCYIAAKAGAKVNELALAVESPRHGHVTIAERCRRQQLGTDGVCAAHVVGNLAPHHAAVDQLAQCVSNRLARDVSHIDRCTTLT